MKLTIHTKPLLAALDRVKMHAAGTLPVLSCLLLRAEGGRLHVASTDLDLYLETSAEAMVDDQGSLCVNARRFAGIVAGLGLCDIELSADDKHNLTIRRGLSRILLHGLPADEFPPTPESKDAKASELPQAELKRGLSRVAPFQSEDTTRWVLCGVALQSEAGSMIALGTDGRRMRMDKLVCEFTGKIIVPAKAVAHLMKLCDGEATAICSYTESWLSVNGGEWSLRTKLIKGNYPNWKQVIPGDSKFSAIGNRDEFLDTLRVASLMTSEKSRSVKLALGQQSTLSSNTPDCGNAQIDLPGFALKEPLAIAFDPGFLRDAIQSFPSDEITLQFISEMDPLKIEDATGVCVVCNMRIS